MRVDKGAEGVEGTAGEEVGLLSVFEKVQQVGDGLALAVGQHILIVDRIAACDGQVNPYLSAKLRHTANILEQQ